LNIGRDDDDGGTKKKSKWGLFYWPCCLPRPLGYCV
jgi:hypothetical protein